MASETAKKSLARILSPVIIASAFVAAWFAWSAVSSNPKTDTAELDAPVVHIAPSVPGRIVSIEVENNAAVKKGDVLFRIDPEPYQLRLDQAKAELAAAEAEVAQGGRNLASEQTNADVASKQVERARQNADLAKQTLDRLEPLLGKGYVTAQQVDQAKTSYSDALVSLDQALSQSTGAQTVIGTLDTRKAQVATAKATVALAQRDLDNTVVRAPVDGKISGLITAPGEYAVMATPIFSIIESGAWEAVGFFKETELARIAAGDKADVYLMSNPDLRLEGEVVSIGWGVRSQESATVLGLPVVSNSLNWVKVAKRFPVYVHLHEPPDDLMRLGASAVIVVHSDSTGEDGPHAGH